jgi:hypothetical protein
MGPLASGIMSQASKFFGADKIKAIFGDDNPFSSIFSSGNKKSNDSNGSSSGGKFTSTSTNEGIRNASNWAQQLVDSGEQQGYGPDGCTKFAQDYLRHAGNPFADQMNLYVPTLMQQAKGSELWKDPSQPGVEGDIALVDTDGKMDEPDHAIISDGQGGYFGNSSSTLQVKHGNIGDTFGSSNLWGYVATGVNNGGTVVTGNKSNDVNVAAEAGPTSGGSKFGPRYGRGKFGLGRFGRGNLPYTAEQVAQAMNGQIDANTINNSKHGRGFLSNITSLIDRNIINPNKRPDQNQQINPTTTNTLPPLPPLPDNQQIPATIDPNQLQSTTQTPSANAVTTTASINYKSEFNQIISLLSVIANAVTGGNSPIISNTTNNQQNTSVQNNQNPPRPTDIHQDNKIKTKAQSILTQLSSMGNGSQNGIGDTMVNKDTQSIISAIQAVITM